VNQLMLTLPTQLQFPTQNSIAFINNGYTYYH
jgi:hypothetical protein